KLLNPLFLLSSNFFSLALKLPSLFPEESELERRSPLNPNLSIHQQRVCGMATAEVDNASLAPRYAPDDPSLPNPWKGLIDGSSGAIYYWNPDTNITQYERPADLGRPLLSGPPKLAPIPTARTLQSNQAGPQLNQTQQQMGQQMPQSSQQQYMPQQQPQQQMNQQMEHQVLQHQGHHMSQQFPHHQSQQMPYQQNPHMQGQPQAHQNGHQQGQHFQPQQGHQFMPQQGQKAGFPQRNEYGSYPSQAPQDGGVLSNQNLSFAPLSSPIPQQFTNSHHQQMSGPMAQNQNEMSVTRSQQPGNGNEFFHNPHNEGAFGPHRSKFSAVSMTPNQQEMRIPQNATPGNTGGSKVFTNNALIIPSSAKMLGSSEVTNLLPAETYCKQHEITVTGDNVPSPFTTFEATGFPPEILGAMQNAGFFSPTPIQAQTWPIALQSKDIVAIAKTGSGKTLGYLIPAFIHLRRPRSRSLNGPVVLILAPTRELATQIQEEVVKFGRSSRITCTCLYGGAPKAAQLRELDQGVDIVVATPGRLNDILEMKRIDFRQISFLVLDEADRMLDMGFEPQIRTIVKEIPPSRQTLMYTATWPKEVRKIAGDLLVNPVQVNIGNVDELAANKSITQYVEVVPQLNKQRRLEQIIRSQERGSKILIFCSTKKCCDQLSRGMGRAFGTAAIHGDKSQQERDYVLNQFRSGKSPILVATDVAARGLDVKDIRVVINYDFPTGIEDYVHRIGRTGRAGATGVAYTFFCDQDRKHASDLVKVLEGANQIVPPEVRDMAMNGGHNFVNRWSSGGRGGRGDMRDGGFGGGRGMRDGGISGGRGGMRDNGYSGGRGGSFGGRSGRSDMRDGGFGGRNDFNNRGGRNDFGGGRGSRGRGFSGSGGGCDDWSAQNGHRGRSYSRSRSHSRSRSRSRSRSMSRKRSRSRSLERVVRSRDPSTRKSKFSSPLRVTVAEPTVQLPVAVNGSSGANHTASG
ncbi:hypothetical protein GIB67_021991, partial [Kingdonia uniflora]